MKAAKSPEGGVKVVKVGRGAFKDADLPDAAPCHDLRLIYGDHDGGERHS
ncbi:hypothetical protein [Kribbella qitaiheensis]|nr:hypothetical protein [Kribbella qitaiheensis]